MTRDEILKAIEAYQDYIDLHIAGKQIRFKNFEQEVSALEKLWDAITGRRNSKFCRSCGGSAIREALIICENYRKRALKEIQAETVTMSEPEEPKKEVVKTPERKPTKPKTNVKRKPTK